MGVLVGGGELQYCAGTCLIRLLHLLLLLLSAAAVLLLLLALYAKMALGGDREQGRG